MVMNNSRQVRDLIWCIRSPALLSDAESELFPSDQWFAEQTILENLETDAPPEHFRLGIHFEKIYQYWLNHHETYQLRAANLQVQGTDRTLGEFDLLVADIDRVEHWELAIKFYINYQDSTNASVWFGPDPTDNLAGKVRRMLTHQLTLGQTPEAQQLLRNKNIDLNGTRCIVKGRLYHPWQRQQVPPSMVNPRHLQGWWLHEKDLSELKEYSVVYLSKQHWLSEICPEDDLALLTPEALKQFLQDTTQIAPQFALLDLNRREISRGFILKSRWFELASHAAAQA